MSVSDIVVIYYVYVNKIHIVKKVKKRRSKMTMYQYYCEYKTKSGQRCGETIYARDSLEAREIIKKRPDFAYLFNSPQKMN